MPRFQWWYYQALPPDWEGESPALFPSSSLPTVMTNQPTDGMNCNTYFYDPLVSFCCHIL